MTQTRNFFLNMSFGAQILELASNSTDVQVVPEG